MAIATLLTSIYSYVIERGNVENEMSDIMMNLTRATKKSSALSKTTAESKAWVKANYESRDSEYRDLIDEINDEYNSELAKIAEWETELNSKKNDLDLRLSQITEAQKMAETMVKTDITSEFSYGGSSSS